MRHFNRSKQVTKALIVIRELILSGEFPSGKRISYIAATERLGLSKVSVKQALTELEYQGLIDITTNSGFTVKSFSPDDVYDAIEIRGQLEGMAAYKLALTGLDSEQKLMFEDVLNAIDNLILSSQNFDEIIGNYIQLNSEFHELLIDFADSQMIRRSLGFINTLPFSSPNDFVFGSERLNEQILHLQIAQDQHKTVYQAICKGDAARAEFIMREHARLATRNFNKALSQKKDDYSIPALALVSN